MANMMIFIVCAFEETYEALFSTKIENNAVLLSPSGNGRKTLTFPAERDFHFVPTGEDFCMLALWKSIENPAILSMI